MNQQTRMLRHRIYQDMTIISKPWRLWSRSVLSKNGWGKLQYPPLNRRWRMYGVNMVGKDRVASTETVITVAAWVICVFTANHPPALASWTKTLNITFYPSSITHVLTAEAVRCCHTFLHSFWYLTHRKFRMQRLQYHRKQMIFTNTLGYYPHISFFHNGAKFHHFLGFCRLQQVTAMRGGYMLQ